MGAPTACRAVVSCGRPGPQARFSACGYGGRVLFQSGTGAGFLSQQRALDWPASPTAKRRRAARRAQTTVHSVTWSARPLAFGEQEEVADDADAGKRDIDCSTLSVGRRGGDSFDGKPAPGSPRRLHELVVAVAQTGSAPGTLSYPRNADNRRTDSCGYLSPKKANTAHITTTNPIT